MSYPPLLMEPPPLPPAYGDIHYERPCSNVDLTIKAHKLRDADLFSKSDPMCVVHLLEGVLQGRSEWREHGRTECIMSTLNPEWAQRIRVPYYFEERQMLRFDIYDVDSNSRDLSKHDFLGRFECELAEIVSAGGEFFVGQLKEQDGTTRRNLGQLLVTADEVDDGQREVLQLRLRATQVDRMDFCGFGRPDPFLNIYHISDDNTTTLAHRTEWLKSTVNPEWAPFDVDLRRLCKGERSRPFLVECLDYDLDGSHDHIGAVRLTVDELLAAAEKRTTSAPLIDEKKRKRNPRGYKKSGVLHIDSVSLIRHYSFLDYIRGGTELDFAVSIDFTASNGAQTSPTSLHYTNPITNMPNSYELAIRAVTQICNHYNKAQEYAAYGFGAKLNGPNSEVSHFFPLRKNPDGTAASLRGSADIMQAYRETLASVHFYGPTNFAPTIHAATRRAAGYVQDPRRYLVLLIITDGVITDMPATKEAIINACSLPLSIIIVGVGNANFDAMNELDGEGPNRLQHKGRMAARDIVQFVPLRDYLTSWTSVAETERAMLRLDKEVLAEIPTQLTGYMQSRRLVPLHIKKRQTQQSAF